MNKYETLFIIKPDQSDDEIQAILDRLSKSVESSQGKLAAIEHWGSRRLAYPVRYRGERLVRGYYVLLTYLGNGQVVDEVERNIKIIDPAFRFLTVKQEGEVDPAAVTEVVITHAKEQPPEPEPIADALAENEAREPTAETAKPTEHETGSEDPSSPEQDDDRGESDEDDDSDEDKE